MTAIDGGLRTLLRRHLPPLGALVQPIETGGTGRGVADCWVQAEGGPARAGWAELKGQVSRGRVDLSAEQSAWLAAVRRRGGRACVLVRLRHQGGRRRGLGVDELWWLDAACGDAIRREGLRDAEAPWVLGRWTGGPRCWDWRAILEAIVTGATTEAAPAGTGDASDD